MKPKSVSYGDSVLLSRFWILVTTITFQNNSESTSFYDVFLDKEQWQFDYIQNRICSCQETGFSS